ncbi:MAG TPA: glycosyltransferase [Alphaproteobacteria bacterium]|nr:glycosyltransferase [Alphaproteobacteria bacterium]
MAAPAECHPPLARCRLDLASSEAPINILHVIASLAVRTGGPAKAAIDMARAVARLGHEVAIYATDRELLAEERRELNVAHDENGVEVRYFRQHAPRAFAASLPLARALGERIARVDLVHLHSLYLFHDWAAARACRRLGVPYLLRPHGTLDPYHWSRHRWRKRLIEAAFQNRVTRGAAALHFTSDDEMGASEPHACGAPGVVVPNGLDLTEYADLPPAGALRRRYPEIGARRIVLFLGRLNFKKGLDLLVPAFGLAVADHPDLHLVIAGPDDGMEGPVRRLVAASGLGSRVTFTGVLTGRAKLAAFCDAYLFALPSYAENFGIAVVEAMACGLPVAISDRVAIWRDIEQSGAGSVGRTDVASVAEQLRRLAAEPAVAAAMGARGKALVEARFSWDTIGRQLEAVYRRLARTSPK